MKSLLKSLSCLMLLSILTFNVQAADNPVTFKTSLGQVFVGPKSSSENDEYTWIVKVGDQVVKTFDRELVTPFVLGIPDLYSGKPAVIDNGETVSFIINPATGGQACAGSDPFIVFLKKGVPAKTINIKNDCFEISKLIMDGDKFIISMYEHKKDLVYQNGEFLTRAPKNEPPKLKKGAMSFKVDDGQVLNISGIVTKGNADRPFIKLPEAIQVSVDCEAKKCDRTIAINELYPSTTDFDDKLSSKMGKEVTVKGSFFWPASWKSPGVEITEIVN